MWRLCPAACSVGNRPKRSLKTFQTSDARPGAGLLCDVLYDIMESIEIPHEGGKNYRESHATRCAGDGPERRAHSEVDKMVKIAGLISRRPRVRIPPSQQLKASCK